MKEKNVDIQNSNRIMLSSVTSRVGNAVFDYANKMILVSIFASKPLLMSLYQSSETMISIVFNLFAGAFADKVNRKKILITTDLLSGITCLIGFLFLDTPYLYLAMLLGNILLAILSTYNSPSYNAMIKESISEEYIEMHFSRFTMVKETFSIASPSIGVLVWQLFGLKVSYMFNAATFLFSAYISSKIVIQLPPKEKKDKKFVFKQIAEGLQYMFKHKTIMYLLIISAMVNFFLSGYNLSMPYLNNYFSKEMSNFFGASLISESIGAISFSAINNRYSKGKKKDVSQNKMLLFLILSGLAIVLLPIQDALVKNAYLSLVPLALIGGFLTMFNIQFFTIVQKSVDSEYVGRVYSVIFTIAILFMPVGSLLFGLIFNSRNLFVVLISGIGIIITVLLYKVFV
ncbi:MFS transporter, partial [Enterococcus faecium]|nr:MFS transporter [Enterococcus faecium]